MAISQATKDLVSAGVWASSAAAQRELPETAGIDRATGFDLAYEQLGSGKFPERTVWNQRLHEWSAGIIDIVGTGILPWDAEVTYTPSADAAIFVTTPTGIHVSETPSGPGYGNPTDPDSVGQTLWRRY